MNHGASPNPVHSMLLVGRGVFIELARKKDAYVLFILMGFFLAGVGVISLIGIDKPSTATFLLNLGMGLACYAAHVMTLVLASRQIPDEIENRTLYPMLAKPVDRGTVLVGKWAACSASGMVVLLSLMLMGWVPVPKMEVYHGAMLVQTVVLLALSIGMLAALGILLSLVAPKGVTLVVLGILFFFGHKMTGFANARFLGTTLERPVEWLAAYVPSFDKLNTITRYTDGIGAIPAGEFLGLVVHALLVIALALALASALFSRRPL